MARKKEPGGGGAPEWLVTFADLMSLLVCFFVLIISFSTQDEKKMQIVAGSMREAFGMQNESRAHGLIERDGLPANPLARNTSLTPRPLDFDPSSGQKTDQSGRGESRGAEQVAAENARRDELYRRAVASIRQSLADMPEIAELSKNIVYRADEEGLHIELVDQDGRAMFASSARDPYPFLRDMLVRMAPVIASLPHPIRISGHTSRGVTFGNPDLSNWELSSDRAEEVRRVLVYGGVPADRFSEIIGKADTQPLFENDPYLTANRRVTLTLLDEEPPLPPDLQP